MNIRTETQSEYKTTKTTKTTKKVKLPEPTIVLRKSGRQTKVSELPAITSPDHIVEHCRHYIGDDEIFMVVYMNQQHKVIDIRIEGIGTVDSCFVNIRRIMRSALELNASAIILVHNHPSGSLVISEPDKMITSNIAYISRFMGIRLIDHLIITDKSNISFSSEGYLKENSIQNYLTEFSRLP